MLFDNQNNNPDRKLLPFQIILITGLHLVNENHVAFVEDTKSIKLK